MAAGDLQTDGLRVEWANQRKPVPLSRLAQGHDHGGDGGDSGAGPGPGTPKGRETTKRR